MIAVKWAQYIAKGIALPSLLCRIQLPAHLEYTLRDILCCFFCLVYFFLLQFYSVLRQNICAVIYKILPFSRFPILAFFVHRWYLGAVTPCMLLVSQTTKLKLSTKISSFWFFSQFFKELKHKIYFRAFWTHNYQNAVFLRCFIITQVPPSDDYRSDLKDRSQKGSKPLDQQEFGFFFIGKCHGFLTNGVFFKDNKQNWDRDTPHIWAVFHMPVKLQFPRELLYISILFRVLYFFLDRVIQDVIVCA